MEEKLTLSTLYRAQIQVEGKILQTMPVKRVSLSEANGLVFNPDNTKYIYFSPSSIHHSYYIHKKMLDSVNFFLDIYGKKVKNLVSRDLGNLDLVKIALEELGDLKKEIKIESIALEYLAVFKKMIDDCAVKQGSFKSDNKMYIPQISDTKTYGGGIGLAESWLDLLRDTTVFIKTKEISIDDLFMTIVSRKKMSKREVYSRFDTSEHILQGVYHIRDKNGANAIRHDVMKIEENGDYALNETTQRKDYFSSLRRELRQQRALALDLLK